MKIAISSDEYFPTLETLFEEVKRYGHEIVYFGPKQGEDAVDWPDVTSQAVECVVKKQADEAIVLCWTGTGCTLVANKYPGIRAALCVDAETAKGARIWNHANVLGVSLRLTSPSMLKEILKVWFETPHSQDEWNKTQIEKIVKLDERS
jgi:ribose 5-phosphate isomerase B